MSGVEVPPGSPLAAALTELVQSKVAEIGWSSGAEDDSALAQYIVLMLGNDKSKEAIATELANDLLGSDANKDTAAQFVDWLFQTIHGLTTQQSGTVSQSQGNTAPEQSASQSDDMMMDEAEDETTDAQM